MRSDYGTYIMYSSIHRLPPAFTIQNCLSIFDWYTHRHFMTNENVSFINENIRNRESKQSRPLPLCCHQKSCGQHYALVSQYVIPNIHQPYLSPHGYRKIYLDIYAPEWNSKHAD